MRLDPKHLTLGQLLHGRLFRIPNYQRAYSWQSKQRADLFADIDTVYRTKQDHFLATVVAVMQENTAIGADEFQVVDVVDGQQRLTTFVLLLKAIEKAVDGTTSVEQKIKRELLEMLVKGDDHSLVLLQTNHDSSYVFRDYIRTGIISTGPFATAADKNLVDAAKECEEYVLGWAKRGELVELVSLLKHRLSMIYHELADESAVYRVFEVLNSRGLEVKTIDKLKSSLMEVIFNSPVGAARDTALSEMRQIWQDIWRILGLRLALGDEAMRFAGTLKLPNAPKKVLSEEDAMTVLKSVAGVDIKSALASARWLLKVVSVLDALDRNDRLRAVTRIAHARFVAVAILLRAFGASVEQKLMRQWERLAFRLFGLALLDSRHRVGEFVRLAHDIQVKEIPEALIISNLKELGGGKLAIDNVLAEIDWTDCYNNWTEELRYLLFRYEEHLARKNGQKINEAEWMKIWSQEPARSIEHIKPQSSRVEYVHYLGNLTMLPPGVNSSLKDKTPAQKAEAYAHYGLLATRQVGRQITEGGWTKETVLRREADIKNFVRQEWKD